jgi:triosephosphate isomerase
VNPGNARGFFSQSEIDGALVGGASLSADKFLRIIEQTS